MSQLDWTKIVSSPLGLAAFALFMIFLFLRKTKSVEQYQKYFLLAAVAVLVTGLTLAVLNALDQKTDEMNDNATVEQQAATESPPETKPGSRDCKTDQNVKGDGNISIGCLEGSGIHISTGK